jgi:hypothetical protein
MLTRANSSILSAVMVGIAASTAIYRIRLTTRGAGF